MGPLRGRKCCLCVWPCRHSRGSLIVCLPAHGGNVARVWGPFGNMCVHHDAEESNFRQVCLGCVVQSLRSHLTSVMCPSAIRFGYATKRGQDAFSLTSLSHALNLLHMPEHSSDSAEYPTLASQRYIITGSPLRSTTRGLTPSKQPNITLWPPQILQHVLERAPPAGKSLKRRSLLEAFDAEPADIEGADQETPAKGFCGLRLACTHR
jgi:hypothetical protein